MQNPFARAARDSVRLTARTVAVTLTAFLIASCGGEGSSEAPTPSLFSTTVVFGASLTDTGNCGSPSAGACPPPPYATGRASNGTLFVETIAGRYGAAVAPSSRGGTNFAYGGARTGNIPGLATQSTVPSMVAQLQQFIDRPTSGAALNPQTLFVVDASTFGNNINAALGTPTVPGPLAAGTITSQQFVGAAVTDIVTIMTRLYNAGARNILVVNSPNVGATPLVSAAGPVAAGTATQLSQGFNGALAGAIQANLLPTAPGLRVYTLDLFTISNTVTANPALAGLTNVTAPCLTTTVCATPDTYLYWDSFHPTRAAGAYIAAQAATLLPSP